MELVNKIFDKISEYDLLNTIIPGAVFVVLFKHSPWPSMTDFNVWETLTIVYLSGLIVNRFGSVVVESLLRRLFKHARYEDYLAAEGKDQKLKILVAHNNLYRSLISEFSLIIILRAVAALGIMDKIGIAKEWLLVTVLMLLVILLVLAYGKQTKYIVSRVEKQVGSHKATGDNGIKAK